MGVSHGLWTPPLNVLQGGASTEGDGSYEGASLDRPTECLWFCVCRWHLISLPFHGRIREGMDGHYGLPSPLCVLPTRHHLHLVGMLLGVAINGFLMPFFVSLKSTIRGPFLLDYRVTFQYSLSQETPLLFSPLTRPIHRTQ